MLRNDWHCFIDTTEIFLGTAQLRELAGAAAEAHTRLYISEVVMTERIFQRVRNFNESFDRAESFQRTFGKYSSISMSPRPTETELVQHFRKELIEELDGVATVFELSDLPVDIVRDIVRVCSARDKNIGFEDGIMLASCLAFALKRDFRAVILVSGNRKDFWPSLLEDLEHRYNVSILLVRSVAELAKQLRAKPDVALALQKFMERQGGHLLDYVEREFKSRLVESLAGMVEQRGQGQWAESIRRERDTMRLGLRGVSSVLEHPPKDTGASSAAIELSVDLYPPNMSHQTVEFQGQGLVRFENGAFVGDVKIERLAVRGTDWGRIPDNRA